MSKSPCVIVEMRLDSWETFVLTHHFLWKLQRFFGSAGQGETKLASAVVVHPEVERPEASMIGNLAVRDLRTLGRRVSLTWAMAAFGCFWCPCYMLSKSFKCFHVYQPSSGTTASERGPVVNHPEAETPAGTWETLEGSSGLILVCSSRRESGPWSMVRVESCGNPVFILQTCSNCARRPDQRQTLWRQLLWHEWGECGGHWRLGKAVGGDASNCFKY